MTPEAAIWLNKFISESGFCSRREADKWILDGKVTVNGVIAEKGDQIKKGDRVRVNGMLIKPRKEEEIIFIALNKPVGIVSTTENVKDNIVQFVNHPERIFPIGRLDKDSQGLIFLTNNGDIVNKILRAGNNHEKEYIVTVDKVITDAFIAGMSKGVPMMGTVTKKCKVTKEGIKSFRITLIQGLNRQIRRMCEYFGYDVVKLERVRIMNIRLKGIPPGEWRDLTEEEMQQIYQLTEGSTSEYKTHVATATENNEKKSTFSKFRKRPLIREKENHPFSEITPINEKSQVSTKKNIAEDQTIKSKKNQSKSNKASDTKYSKAPSGKRIGKSRPKVEPKSYSHKGGPGKSHNSSKRQGR